MRLNTIRDTIERLIRELGQASVRYAFHIDVAEAHDTQGRAQLYRRIDNWQRELTKCLYKLGRLRQGAQYRNYQLNAARLSYASLHLRKTSDQEVDRLEEFYARALVAKDALVEYVNRRAQLSDMEFDSLLTDLLSNLNDWGDVASEIGGNEILQIAQCFKPASQVMYTEVKSGVKPMETPQTAQGGIQSSVLTIFVVLRCIQLIVKRKGF